MTKTEYDLRVIMYSTYATHHRLCNGYRITIQQTQLLNLTMLPEHNDTTLSDTQPRKNILMKHNC